MDLASSMKAVDAVQMAAEAFANAEGLDREASHFLAVALREAAMNAITHGNRGDESNRVIIRFKSDKNGNLVFEVKDEGEGFDPKQLPDPLEPENLRRGSGRGVFYMRKFTDKVRYRFPKSGGTVVELHKKLTGPRRLSKQVKKQQK
jgi:serine/threonine-protein kinase RsbW